MIKTGDNINADHFVGTYTAGESIAAGDAVAYDHSDNKVYKASASAWSYRINFIGFAPAAATANNPVLVNCRELVAEKTGLTVGSDYYLSNTQGAISTSAGTISRKIGRALTTSQLKRPKNGAIVSPLISRALSSATAFTSLIAANSGGSMTLSINGTGIIGDSRNEARVAEVTLAPDDTVTFTADGGLGIGTPYVRILDR